MASSSQNATNNDDVRIAFVGAGNMALSMAKGFARNGIKPERIWATAPSMRNLQNFEKLGCQITQSPDKLFSNDNSDNSSKTEYYIFLCTKPKTPFETKGFWNFLQSADFQRATHTGTALHIISVMVGINLRKLESSLKEFNGKFNIAFYVSRIMPNLGCEVNASPISATFGQSMTDNHKQNLTRALSILGPVFDVSESALDASVGIAGSGLGFYCTFLQALADGAVADGLSREDALRMGAQTAIAMGKLVLEGKHPIVLRDSICSPAGSTIAGVQMLEEEKFSSLVMNTVKVTSGRGRAIAAKLNES